MFRKLRRVFFYVFLFALAISWALPVFWALAASLRPFQYPIARGSIWFSHSLTLANYARTASLAPFGHYYLNTIIVVTMTLGVQIVTITMAAFAFVNFEFAGKRLLF